MPFRLFVMDRAGSRLLKKSSLVLKALFSLATSLLVSVGGLQGFPLLFLTMDHTHQISLAKDHAHLDLVFRHARQTRGDATPIGLPGPHQHDGTDQLVSEDTRGEVSPADHVFHLSDQQKNIPAGTKTITPLKSIPLIGLSQFQPVLPKPITVHPPPFPNPTLLSIRTTVLLI